MSSKSGRYRQQIVGSLRPVRPLPAPSRRTLLLLPLGILLAVTAPLMNGLRGDLSASALLSWGVTALQAMVGLWLLTLAFREAVPGHNVSRTMLAIAATLTALVIVAVTLATSAYSATTVPIGRAWEYWSECVIWPAALGAPFAIVATLMASRAFPTRPAIAGALCGLSAGVLSDAGWRLSCWISSPAHVIGSHGVAMLVLMLAGSGLAVVADARRWRRVRETLG